MIKLFFYKVILSCFFAIITLSLNAQGRITVKASVDKNRILIGEQFFLTIQSRFPENQPSTFLSIDTIPHFEILETRPPLESNANGEKIIKQSFLMTSFDSGHWVIPSFRVAQKYFSDTIPMDVVFSEFDPNQPYHDIKNIIEVEPEKKQSWLWYIVGGGILLLLLLVWLLTRKKKPVVKAPAVTINPYDEAMQQLEVLQKANYPAKQFYSGMIDVLRLYIFRKKGVLSLQKTTDDLILQLKNINLEKEQYLQLSQALRLGDFVKFAKYVPSPEDDRFVFESIKSSIRNIEEAK